MNEHLFIISHRRSGTHLMIDSVLNNFDEYGRFYLNIDQLNSRHNSQISASNFILELEDGPRIIKSHMHSGLQDYFENNHKIVDICEQLLKSSKVIYIYRDGRDVLTSLFYYLSSYNRNYFDKGFSTFIRMENEFDRKTYKEQLNRVECWRSHVEGWLGMNNIYPISFESLVMNYEQCIRDVADYLDITIKNDIKSAIRKGKSKTVLGIRDKLVEKCRKYFSMVSGKIYTSVNFRTGKIGDHKTLFSIEDLIYFDSIAHDIMLRLGYYER